MSISPRERIILALNHKEADRVPIHGSPWETTIARWHKEGLPENVHPHEYFHYEMDSVGADRSLFIPHKVFEETEEYEIGINTQGAYYKQWKKMTSTPEYTDFLIKDRKTWEEYKPNLKKMKGRVNVERDLEFCRRKRAEGQYFMCGGGMGYDQTQGIIGSERLLMAMALEPDWVKDMFESSADILIDTAEEMIGLGFEFDGAFICDDMGYRNASLFSPKMYKELLFPVHKRVFDFFHGKKMKVILHSCGCIKELVPFLIEAGLDCLQPLEVKAGMDLLEMKRLYGGKLSFMGGLDARKIASQDQTVIETEVRDKVTYAKRDGGYIFHEDHSVPDNVSFEQYKRFVELGLKYGRY